MSRATTKNKDGSPSLSMHNSAGYGLKFSTCLRLTPTLASFITNYSKTWLKWPLKKKIKNCFQDQLLLKAGQTYCRMLQRHSAILSTFIISYHMSLRPLFCLILSGRFYCTESIYIISLVIILHQPMRIWYLSIKSFFNPLYTNVLFYLALRL